MFGWFWIKMILKFCYRHCVAILLISNHLLFPAIFRNFRWHGELQLTLYNVIYHMQRWLSKLYHSVLWSPIMSGDFVGLKKEEVTAKSQGMKLYKCKIILCFAGWDQVWPMTLTLRLHKVTCVTSATQTKNRGHRGLCHYNNVTYDPKFSGWALHSPDGSTIQLGIPIWICIQLGIPT